MQRCCAQEKQPKRQKPSAGTETIQSYSLLSSAIDTFQQIFSDKDISLSLSKSAYEKMSIYEVWEMASCYIRDLIFLNLQANKMAGLDNQIVYNILDWEWFPIKKNEFIHADEVSVRNIKILSIFFT